MQKLFILLIFLACTTLHAQQYGWRVIATPRPGYQMKAVEFKDSLHGWCSAGDQLYRTEDGGHTWYPGSQPSLPNGFFDLSFSDTVHGWAVGTFFGDDALIWRTTDGGRTWSEKLHKNGRRYNSTVARGTDGNITTGSTYGISFPLIRAN
ncbi:MAG: hypothetical protein HY277_07155 [Ignavibacteriales bacterium]|nr:hypothetical protein [Ignavibacteriales bacterium]